LKLPLEASKGARYLISVVCPLCGKHTPIGSFSPSEDDDIKAVSVRGLGRGRGFEVTGKESLLDSPEHEDTVSQISNRVLEIVSFLRDREMISDEDIIEALELDSLDN